MAFSPVVNSELPGVPVTVIVCPVVVAKLLNTFTSSDSDIRVFKYEIVNALPDNGAEISELQPPNILAIFAADEHEIIFSAGTEWSELQPLNILIKFVPLDVFINGIVFKTKQLLNICKKLEPD